MNRLDIASITLDPDLQPRAQIHEDVLREYGHLIADGVEFPPVVVYFDGATYWLADGYHRWHAHHALGLVEIAADVRQGSKRDALLHSLAANAQHGKQRGPADLRKAYDIATRNQMVAPTDTAAVARLLSCSERWARDLTREAREAAQRERDAAVLAARAEGRSYREIERDTGVPAKTAHRVSERNPSEVTRHAEPIAAAMPIAWSQVLAALSTVADLPPLDDLFPPPPHAAELAAQRVPHAVAWIGAFARRLDYAPC